MTQLTEYQPKQQSEFVDAECIVLPDEPQQPVAVDGSQAPAASTADVLNSTPYGHKTVVTQTITVDRTVNEAPVVPAHVQAANAEQPYQSENAGMNEKLLAMLFIVFAVACVLMVAIKHFSENALELALAVVVVGAGWYGLKALMRKGG